MNGAGNVNDEIARDSYFHYLFTKGPLFSPATWVMEQVFSCIGILGLELVKD